MTILITSGGTTEKIDSVRAIVNNSTGRLGCAIAEAFAAHSTRIIYICGKNAARPKAHADITEIGGVADLQNTLAQVFAHNSIDIIIHAMAVADYRVAAVTINGISRAINDKISSGHDKVTLHLEKTPKIIATLRPASPKSTIVGFKLMANVPRGTLIDAGRALLAKNDCDFVLANDAAEISGNIHKGYLIDKGGHFSTHNNKDEIAQAMVGAAISHWQSNAGDL